MVPLRRVRIWTTLLLPCLALSPQGRLIVLCTDHAHLWHGYPRNGPIISQKYLLLFTLSSMLFLLLPDCPQLPELHQVHAMSSVLPKV